MKPIVHRLLAVGCCLVATTALAKLPAPSDEAKAKADEAAAKTAHAGKSDSYKLCVAMDRVAAGYQTRAKLTGKPASAPTDTPACVNPGAYVAAAPSGAPAPAAAPAVPVVAAAPAPTKK